MISDHNMKASAQISEFAWLCQSPSHSFSPNILRTGKDSSEKVHKKTEDRQSSLMAKPMLVETNCDTKPALQDRAPDGRAGPAGGPPTLLAGLFQPQQLSGEQPPLASTSLMGFPCPAQPSHGMNHTGPGCLLPCLPWPGSSHKQRGSMPPRSQAPSVLPQRGVCSLRAGDQF